MLEFDISSQTMGSTCITKTHRCATRIWDRHNLGFYASVVACECMQVVNFTVIAVLFL